MQLFIPQPFPPKDGTSEETLQVGRQWSDKQIPLGARRPVSRLQIANVAPILDVLPSVLASITAVIERGRLTIQLKYLHQ